MDRKLSAGALFPRITLARLSGGEVNLGQPKPGMDWQMVVVYRGRHCPMCSTYLRKLDPLVGRLNDIGIDVVAASADNENRARPHIEALRVSIPIGIDLSVVQMQELGLYISHPRSSAESPRPFAEPGLFVTNAAGLLQVTDISNAPFVRPDLEALVGGLEFIRNPENNYPIRGTLN